MKLVYIILTLVALVSAEPEASDIFEVEVLKTIDVNKLVDRFLPYIARCIVENGLDPLELPRNVLKFWMPLPSLPPIMYRASLTLQSGTLKRLSCLVRDGDATLTYEDKIVTMDVGAKFQALQGAYDYALRLLILAQNGRVTALAENVRAKISVVFNTTDYTLALNKLELQASGRVSVDVQSKSGWIDWIVKSIINAVIPLFKNTITKTVQVEASNAIRKFFNEINNKIPREVTARFFEHELLKRA